MKTSLQVEADIANNLISLANERGIPTSFTKSDIDEVLNDPNQNDAWKYNTIRRIRASLHEVLYAPPSRG